MDFVDGNICAPLGFQVSGVLSGHKDAFQSDIALIVTHGNGTAAAVYTQNQIEGHSVRRTRRILSRGGPIHAVLINSGNANCGLGVEGDEDTETLSHWTAKHLGLDCDEVLTMSTGYIGIPLPLDSLKDQVLEAVDGLGRDGEHARDASEAILTTDTIRKVATVHFMLKCEPITMSAMAKGSSMIHPNMATLLGLITCDAQIEAELLQELLRVAVDKTFNRVTVDGETSPCDMVIALASGLSDNSPLTLADLENHANEVKTFSLALEGLLMRLARMIASDAEGASKLIDVRVEAAETPQDAYEVALSVARSPLFKAAMFGEVPNWGRILAAVGNAIAVVDPNRLSIQVGPLTVYSEGTMIPYDTQQADRILSNPEIIVTINLGRGAYADHYWTSDLTYDSVKMYTEFHS